MNMPMTIKWADFVINNGFWVGMGVSLLIVILMIVVFWRIANKNPAKKED